MGKLSGTVALSGFPPEGSKFEDLAIDPATHSFFAVGSHSGWDREVLEATSVLLRFRLGEGSEGLELHQDRIEAFPLYKSFEKLGLWRPMGMKIEGLAVDPKSAELYVGLREPIDRARIYGISLPGLEQAARGGTPPDLGLEVSFDAGRVEETPFSISALLWIPHRRGLLIATSTEDDTTHSFLGNRLWFYSREGQVELIQDTPRGWLWTKGVCTSATTTTKTTPRSRARFVPSRWRVFSMGNERLESLSETTSD
jgi:hypothetical protein